MVYLSRPHHFKFFKGCLPQILLGPFLNNLTHLEVQKGRKDIWMDFVILESMTYRFDFERILTNRDK